MRTSWGLRDRYRAIINAKRDPRRLARNGLLSALVLVLALWVPDGLQWALCLILGALAGNSMYILTRMADRSDKREFFYEENLD